MEQYTIPFICGPPYFEIEAGGKLWGSPVDWRANAWSALLKRVPEDVMSTFYSVTAPEVYELLSDDQLRDAIDRFQVVTVRTFCGYYAGLLIFYTIFCLITLYIKVF